MLSSLLLPPGGSGSERIDERDPGVDDMPNIAGREGEAVLQGRRNELTILDRNRWMKRHDPSPLVGAILIEWENARTVTQHQCREPFVEAGLEPRLGACPGNSKKRSGQGASSSIRWTV